MDSWNYSLGLIYVRVFLISVTYTSMYLLIYVYRLAVGLFFYYIQVLSYLLIVYLAMDLIRDFIRFNKITYLVVSLALSYILVYMSMGLWKGFGLSPYAMDLVGVSINIIHVSTYVMASESLRALITRFLEGRSQILVLYIPSLITWFLTWFPYPLLTLSIDHASLMKIFRYIIPSFINNIFSTFILINSGLPSSVIYNLIPQLFTRITPILPRLDWFIEGSVNAIIPLIGYYMISPHTNTWRRHRRLLRRESENTVKLIIYFTTVVLLILVSTGQLGFRLYVISSRSMEPVLKIGDIVVACSICGDIREGDIVAYVSKIGVIVHRVVEVNREYSYLITKGDRNIDIDPDPVSMENVLGKVVYTIPLIGYIAIYTRGILPLDISIILVIALSITIYTSIQRHK